MGDADRLEAAGWSDLIDHVRTGHWPFAGGALWVDATPAMLLIDIDGEGDPLALAKAGAAAAVHVVRCCDVGGRSEEHTSELQSLMRPPYAVFCLKTQPQPHN